MKRIVLASIISFLFIFIISGLVFNHMLSRSLPDYEGDSESTLINSDIEIYRDSVAVPYILAKNEEDAAFALGYVHAQERLFQMDVFRRAAEGRLSEVFGTSTLRFDQMFLTIGIKRFVKNNFNRYSTETKRMLTAYSKGVNHFIQENEGTLPIEFDVLDYVPYEWKPEHSLMIIRMLAWELNISWWTDFSFSALAEKLGTEKARAIIPDYPENAPTIIPSNNRALSEEDLSFINTDRNFRAFANIDGTHIGSNNWVVNNRKSQSGKVIIANDPHLAYSMPGRWFTAVVQSPQWNAAGLTFPGIPAIAIGTNTTISWVITNIMADDCDFYFETLDSTKRNYKVDGSWRPLQTLKEIIKVKDSADVELDVKYTKHGPIINDVHQLNYFYGNTKPKNYISMRWLGNEFSDEYLAFYKINKANNWSSFKEGVSHFSLPGQNFVYGDKDGNIGYLFGGRLPSRGSNTTTFLLDGSNSSNDWNGVISQQSMPGLFNPAQNFIASANNKTIRDFPYHISNIWEPSSRIERITELLNKKDKHSVSDYMKYQNDVVSPYSLRIRDEILKAFSDTKVKYPTLKSILDLFQKWDGSFNQYSQVPAVYAVYLKYLLKNIYYDELGKELYNEFLFVANVPYRSLIKILNDSSSSFYDNIKTSNVEDKKAILQKSMFDAINYLENRFGKDLKEWQWGSLHQVEFKHTFGGISGLLDNKLNIGPLPIGGDGTTLFNTEYMFSERVPGFNQFDYEEFHNNLGPSMRYIYDFASPDFFYVVCTTGQSGNILSDHYKDMFQSWYNGSYYKVSISENRIKNENNKLFRIIKN